MGISPNPLLETPSEDPRSDLPAEELILSTDSLSCSSNALPTTKVAGEYANEGNKTDDLFHRTTRLQSILSSPRAITLSGIDGLRPGN